MRGDHQRSQVALARVLRDGMPENVWQREGTTIVSSDVGGFIFQSALTGDVKRDQLVDLNQDEPFASHGSTTQRIADILARCIKRLQELYNSICHSTFRPDAHARESLNKSL